MRHHIRALTAGAFAALTACSDAGRGLGPTLPDAPSLAATAGHYVERFTTSRTISVACPGVAEDIDFSGTITVIRNAVSRDDGSQHWQDLFLTQMTGIGVTSGRRYQFTTISRENVVWSPDAAQVGGQRVRHLVTSQGSTANFIFEHTMFNVAAPSGAFLYVFDERVVCTG